MTAATDLAIAAAAAVGHPGEAAGVSARKPAGTARAELRLLRGDVAQIIESMRSGAIRGSHIPALAARLAISQDSLLTQLRLPKSTIAGRIARDEALSSTEQDRVYRVERLLARAEDVVGDAAGAQTWVTHANRALGGVAPLSLLDTEAGYELVLDTLGRIEYGVYS